MDYVYIYIQWGTQYIIYIYIPKTIEKVSKLTSSDRWSNMTLSFFPAKSPAECHQCESHELPWSPPQVPHNTSDFHPLLLFQCFRAAVRLLTVITLQWRSTTLHCAPLTKSNSNCSLIEKKAPCKTGNPQSDFHSALMKPKGFKTKRCWPRHFWVVAGPKGGENACFDI